MGGLIEVFLDPVHGLRDRTVAALLFQPLQAGQQPIADEGLLPADRFQLLVLPPAPLDKLEAPENHAANHAYCGQQFRKRNQCVRVNGHFHAQPSSAARLRTGPGLCGREGPCRRSILCG